MVFRFSSQRLLLLASLTVSCGPEFQASFSPLDQAGAPTTAGGSSANASSGGATGGSATAGNATAGNATAGNAMGGNASGGSSDAGANNVGGSDVNGGSAGAQGGVTGQAGACARRCDALEPWAERSYTLGERVSSVCKAPYNGACAVSTQHEFECQPPTGVVGLGWCSVRQPGVSNGWHEAWRISAACE